MRLARALLLGVLTLALLGAAAPGRHHGAAHETRRGPARLVGTAVYLKDDSNGQVPAAWMARMFDHVQGGDDRDIAAYRAAGGRDAQVYGDPILHYYCRNGGSWEEPRPANECGGEGITAVATRPDEFLHADGPGEVRLHVARGPDGRGYWQEVMNPGSPAWRAAWHAWSERNVHATSAFCDDLGAEYNYIPFAGYNPYPIYKFGAYPKEYYALPGHGYAQWAQDVAKLIDATAQPCVFNGGSNPRNVELFAISKAYGAMIESAWTSDAGLQLAGRDWNTWINNENYALAVAARHRYVFELNDRSEIDPASRAYALASFYLSYEPPYTVIWETGQFADGTRGDPPEYEIMPTAPLQSAGGDIARLRRGNLYRREFAHCYERGREIGRCAAVVNPGPSGFAVVDLPGYTKTLEYSPHSLYEGGHPSWSHGVPRELPPGGAAILSR